MDINSFFVFSFSFLAILGLLILLYVLIPLRTRKTYNKRKTIRWSKKQASIEKLEKKLINQKIEDLEEDNIKLKTTLREDLKNLIEENSKEHLEHFFTNFEKLYPNFKSDILKLAPNLTAKEIKLAAFIKLNVNSKEIANLLHITPESVNKARYRLRKKLQLNTKEDLSNYILNI